MVGTTLAPVLVQAKVLALSLTTKVLWYFDVVDIRTGPSIVLAIVLAVSLQPLVEVKLLVWLPQGCHISRGRREKNLPRP